MDLMQFSDRVKVEDSKYEKLMMNKVAFFDIETTGFNKDKDYIILISFGYFNEKNNFTIKQYFSESISDESKVLLDFSKDLLGFNTWCSYNGIAFDAPFIERRMKVNQIPFKEPQNHIDLYRMIRPYYKQLGLERCNLKTIEKYIGVSREDKIDGGESIELFWQYIKFKDNKVKDKIMLHNYEDVLNLPKIYEFAYDLTMNSDIKRSDLISDKQLGYLRALIKRNNISLNADINKISKKSASKVIDSILKGNDDSVFLENIINNSY